MQADSPGASCFGKLPAHGDFIRYNASGRAMQAFDAWVQKGVMEARNQLGPDLVAAFEEARPTCFFIDVPNAPHILAGAFRPSRDRSGRRYPFLVAVEVEKRHVEGRRIPAWPDRYASFYQAAAALVDDAVSERLAEGDLAGRLQTLRAGYDATPFPVDYEFRMRQTSAQELWTRTWGDPEDGRKYVLLKNLTETMERMTNGRTVKLHAALRLPLPNPVRGLDVSFWLEACWRLLGTTPDAPAFFWTAPEASEPMLLVASAPPPAGIFPHLLAMPSDNGVFTLDDAAGQPTALAALALPARYGTLLEDDALSLHAFIQRLSP